MEATPAPAGPVKEAERIAPLDTLRGVAILGILPVNLMAFFMPMQSLGIPHYLSDAGSETVAFFVVKALFEFKFITLFAMLFGVGISLQQSRAEARGEQLGGRYLWRNLLLLGIGLVHALGLWAGDVLCYYAVTGMVLFFLARLRTRWLALLSGMSLLVPVAFCAFAGVVLMLMDVSPEQMSTWSGAVPRTAAEALADPGASSAPLYMFHPGRETLIYRDGSLLEIFQLRAVTWLTFVVSMVFYGWRIAGLFLLGMVLFRLDPFSPRPARDKVLKVLLALGLLVGLPGEAVSAWLEYGSGGNPVVLVWREVLRHVTSLLMTLGLCSGLLLLPAAWSQAGPLRPFAAIGRTALTNYLGQTVVGVSLAYSFGLAWFGSVTRAQQLGLWVVIVTAQLILSPLWLRWFRFGPVEWAWRSATWLRVQALRR